MGCLNAADALVPDYVPDSCPDGVPCCDSYAYYGPKFCTPGQIFWCHDGMPRVIALEHPNGMRVDVPVEDGVTPYDPIIINGVPYRGDGSPGLMCAGLAAARRAKDWLP